LKTLQSAIINIVISKILLSTILDNIISKQSKQKNLNIYFNNILNLAFISFIIVLEYIDKILAIQQNRSASLSIFKSIFLFAFSILSFFSTK